MKIERINIIRETQQSLDESTVAEINSIHHKYNQAVYFPLVVQEFIEKWNLNKIILKILIY